MKFLRLLATMILVPVVLAGCSSQGGVLGHKDLSYCVIGGAAAGAAAGGGC